MSHHAGTVACEFESVSTYFICLLTSWLHIFITMSTQKFLGIKPRTLLLRGCPHMLHTWLLSLDPVIPHLSTRRPQGASFMHLQWVHILVAATCPAPVCYSLLVLFHEPQCFASLVLKARFSLILIQQACPWIKLKPILPGLQHQSSSTKLIRNNLHKSYVA